MKRLLKFINARNEVVKDEVDTHYYKEWLVQAQERIVKRLVTYDTEQESILEKTLFRLGEEKVRLSEERTTTKRSEATITVVIRPPH